MMDIVIINGSSKPKDSVSGVIIHQLEKVLTRKPKVYQAVQILKEVDPSSILADILQADILLCVCPTYVDSLPAPLIKTLTLIEGALTEHSATKASERMSKPLRPDPKVYAVCNCGYFEAEKTQLILAMLENFADRAGLTWGYGLGIGNGGFVYSFGEKDMSKGPTANVYKALCEFGKAVQEGQGAEQNMFVTPKIPRFFYRIVGNRSWRQMAKKYGTTKLMKARPHIEGSSAGH